MSTFKVKVVKIDDVEAHSNADRLDLVKINDWQCVTSKGNFVKGDLAIYFPIDSILPNEIESKIFGLDAKVKLNSSRVKTIKLRGALSQGLAVKPDLFENELEGIWPLKLGDDVTSDLKITKYEPVTRFSGASNPQAATKKQTNPNFRKYTGIENAKNYPKVFEEGEEISVTEKIHGTNFRAGWVPFYANSFWKKLLTYLGFAPKWEFVFGSHNVQLQSKLIYKGFYQTNVYADAVIKYQLKEILKPGEVIYGEIYGPNIQKGYHYGLKDGRRAAVFFDVIVDNIYLDTIAFKKFAQTRNLPIVPELYRGPFDKEKILALRDGPSTLFPTQKIREGVVVKPLIEQTCFMGRKMLKYISDNYLLKNQDEQGEHH